MSIITSEHFVFSDHETDRQSGTLENRVKNNSQYTQFNVANENTKRTLIGKLSLVRNDAPDNFSRNRLKYDDTEQVIENFKNTDQSGWKTDMELYGYFHFQTISSVDYKGTNPSWQHFWNGESILFLEYNRKIGKKLTLKVGPGISYVQYRLHGGAREDQLTPRLRSRLIYSFAKNQQLQLRYHVGNSQLQINELNEVEQQIDSLQIRRGYLNQKIAFLYKSGGWKNPFSGQDQKESSKHIG